MSKIPTVDFTIESRGPGARADKYVVVTTTTYPNGEVVRSEKPYIPKR